MRILIADDDLATRLMLKGVLANWGFDVQEACNGREAFEHLTGNLPAPLAVLDWMMPEMSGVEVCQKLKARRGSGLPYVILLTAKGQRQDIIAGLDAGADDFIVKPYDPAELRARIGVGQRMVTLQSELVELNQGLERRVSDRTAEVERLLKYQQDLIFRLGHDFRTPLTPLLSLLPLALNAESDPAKREMLRLALDGARTIHTVISRVLELCKLQVPNRPLERQRRNLRELVDDVLRQCAANCAPGRRTLINEVPETLSVLVDNALMRQALDHVIGNAIKFTEAEGQVIVQTQVQNGSVTLAVEDNGVGLEPQHLEHIFEPFYKTDPSRHLLGSPGLGLTVARTIIEQHGGRMWAASAGPHRGTTVYLTLPRVALGDNVTP